MTMLRGFPVRLMLPHQKRRAAEDAWLNCSASTVAIKQSEAEPCLQETARTTKRAASTELSASVRDHTTCPCCSSADVASAMVTSTLHREYWMLKVDF